MGITRVRRTDERPGSICMKCAGDAGLPWQLILFTKLYGLSKEPIKRTICLARRP